MMLGMHLRCVCLDLTFTDLLRFARKRGVTSAAELAVLTGAGSKCGSCRQPLDELLRAGVVRIAGVEYRFPEPPTEEQAD